MTESPIDYVERILSTWPDADRVAEVLRVVRAMQERIDERQYEVDRLMASRERARRERDARPTLVQAREWCEETQRVAQGWTVGDSFIPWAPASLLAALEEEKARGPAAHSEPDREERADPTPSYVGTASSTSTPAMKRGDMSAIPPEDLSLVILTVTAKDRVEDRRDRNSVRRLMSAIMQLRGVVCVSRTISPPQPEAKPPANEEAR